MGLIALNVLIMLTSNFLLLIKPMFMTLCMCLLCNMRRCCTAYPVFSNFTWIYKTIYLYYCLNFMFYKRKVKKVNNYQIKKLVLNLE